MCLVQGPFSVARCQTLIVRFATFQVRAARGLPDDLVRISAGIEDIEDLLADLQQAFVRPTRPLAFCASSRIDPGMRAVASTPTPLSQALDAGDGRPARQDKAAVEVGKRDADTSNGAKAREAELVRRIAELEAKLS